MRSRTDRLKPLKDYLEKEGKASVKEMRGWLSSWSIDGGKLAKSIKSKVIKKNNFFEVTYELEDYYDYVDSGVNGKNINEKNRFLYPSSPVVPFEWTREITIQVCGDNQHKQ